MKLNEEDAGVLLAALDHYGVAVEIADDSGRWLDVSPAFERMTGYARDELIGKTPAMVLRSGAHSPEAYNAIWTRISSGHNWQGTLVSRHKDGSLFRRAVAIAPRMDGNTIVRLVALTLDVTRQEENQEGHKALMEAAGDAILVCDQKSTRILQCNAAASEWFGYSSDEMREQTLGSLATAGQETTLDDIARELDETRRAWVPKWHFQSRTGRAFWGEVRLIGYGTTGPALFVAIVRDVTERIRRDEELAKSQKSLDEVHAQLMHASKLTGIGHLAAAIMHEINNPAAFAMLNLKLAQETLDAHTGRKGELQSLNALRTQLADAVLGMERIAAVARDLQTFARVDPDIRTRLDLNEIVRVAARMVDHDIRHRARLRLELGLLPETRGDPGKIAQVVTNLLVNASHAVKPGAPSENEIRVSTSSDGKMLALVVSDTGSGIEASLRERVFEPFFTTKDPSEGSGLGLSLCAEIVREHAGEISFTSEVERGTIFTVRLPIVVDVDRPQTQRPASGPGWRRLRVLVIDDEPVLVRAYARTLEPQCAVVEAVSGAQALDVLASDAEFDVILCDLMMPNVDGIAFFSHVEAHHPALVSRIVLCTGGAVTERSKRFIEANALPTLSKPITPELLRATVQEIGHARFGAPPVKPDQATPSTAP